MRLMATRPSPGIQVLIFGVMRLVLHTALTLAKRAAVPAEVPAVPTGGAVQHLGAVRPGVGAASKENAVLRGGVAAAGATGPHQRGVVAHVITQARGVAAAADVAAAAGVTVTAGAVVVTAAKKNDPATHLLGEKSVAGAHAACPQRVTRVFRLAAEVSRCFLRTSELVQCFYVPSFSDHNYPHPMRKAVLVEDLIIVRSLVGFCCLEVK